MRRILHLLLAENLQDDTDLIRLELQAAGYEVQSKRVASTHDMAHALTDNQHDVIILDYNLPTFDADSVLAMLNACDHDIPFILLSGSVSEETAAEMMNDGIHDYVMKDNLTRLLPAIVRVLKEVAVRREYKKAELAIKDAALAFKSKESMLLTDANEIIIQVNHAFTLITGYNPEDVIGQTPRMMHSGKHDAQFYALMWDHLKNDGIWGGELWNRRKNGEHFLSWVTISAIADEDGNITNYLGTYSDITEYRRCMDDIQQHTLQRLQELVDERTLELRQSEAETKAALFALSQQKFALDQHSIIAITNVQGVIIYVNDKFCDISGYSREELLGQDHRLVNSGYHPHEFFKEMYQTIAKGQIWHAEICNRAKDGHLYWVDSTIVPFMDDNGKPVQYIAIRHDITELKAVTKDLHEKSIRINTILDELTDTNTELERSQARMVDSLNCAKVIQESILPRNEQFDRLFSDSFIFYKPCDIVGGDLYWLREIDNLVLLAIIDCTGHGVPGAIMTMTVNSVLNHVVDTICSDDPGRILKEVNRVLQETLHLRREGESTVDAGLEIVLCCIDAASRRMTCSASGLSLHVMADGQLTEIKGNRQVIGYSSSKPNFVYTNHSLEFDSATTFYATTDGFLDESGGEKGYGFGRQRFNDMIQQHAQQPLRQQKQLFEQTLATWRGNRKQRDDITVVGFRL